MRPQIEQTKFTGSGKSDDVTDEQLYCSGAVCIYKRDWLRIHSTICVDFIHGVPVYLNAFDK